MITAGRYNDNTTSDGSVTSLGGFVMRHFKRLLGLSLLTLGLFTMGTGVGAAQSQDVTLDGDHGKLSAVLQRPDGKSEYP